uniref:Uncharacterized protein n=1 Tax=Bos mutus grunniens TaxID=30521 RepID=A0A8B9XRS2_BOSMU
MITDVQLAIFAKCWACRSSCLSFSITTWPSTIPRSRNESGAFSAPRVPGHSLRQDGRV